MLTQPLNLKPQASGGEGQLVANYGPQRFTADWNNPSHRAKRLLAELLGEHLFLLVGGGVVSAGVQGKRGALQRARGLAQLILTG
jgi:hypothetical protein